ncbi:tyrosine-protein kinase [Flavobacteriaceae bacterium MHTCC 0001]
MEEKTKPFYFASDNDSINLKEEVAKYIRNWPWFVFTTLLFLCFAYFYLRNTPPTYQTSGKVKILDESSKGLKLPNDLSAFFDNSEVNLENEIEVMTSYRILESVVKRLDLNIRYFHDKRELWELPFKIHPTVTHNTIPQNGEFTIKILPRGYRVTSSVLNNYDIVGHYMEKDHKELPFTIKCNDIPDIQNNINKTYIVKFQPIKETTINLISKLKVNQIGKESEILGLTLVDQNTTKSEAIINEIIYQFNLDGIIDRQLVSQRTIDFVDERFAFLSEELDSIEDEKKVFKQKNSLSEIALDTEFTIIRQANTEDEVIRLETQLEIIALLKQTLEEQKEFKVLPANIGLKNESINELIFEHNNIILERDRILESLGENNPVNKNFVSKLSILRTNISHSLDTYASQIKSSLKKAKQVNNRSRGLFSGIPKKEKVLRAVERQQTIKETLFILLLQKREEAAIDLAITSPSIKIVDFAVTKLTPNSPKPTIIYLGALSLGLLLPFSVFYVIFFIDSKIHTKEDILAKNKTTSVIGEVPYIKDSALISSNTDRTVLAETFRVLRTNSDHSISKNTQIPDSVGKIIYVTSTVKGEGKTFTSVNLALSYLGLQKKVILIGADFRNPQIHTHLNFNRDVEGLSNYLNDAQLDYKDLIKTYNHGQSHLDTLLSGNIPPNPAELLSNGRLHELFDILRKEYDYIVVDTAPTILVTDTLIIAPYADLTIYVTRSRFTEKKLLAYSNELIQSKKLKNVSYLLNGLVPSRLYGYNYNYGYNYGYEYVDTTLGMPWYKRIFRR